jgi:hypothetical protein
VDFGFGGEIDGGGFGVLGVEREHEGEGG